MINKQEYKMTCTLCGGNGRGYFEIPKVVGKITGLEGGEDAYFIDLNQKVQMNLCPMCNGFGYHVMKVEITDEPRRD